MSLATPRMKEDLYLNGDDIGLERLESLDYLVF